MTASGGIWLIVGHQPSRQDRRLEIQVLAARCGDRTGGAVTMGEGGGFRLAPGATTLDIED